MDGSPLDDAMDGRMPDAAADQENALRRTGQSPVLRKKQPTGRRLLNQTQRPVRGDLREDCFELGLHVGDWLAAGNDEGYAAG